MATGTGAQRGESEHEGVDGAKKKMILKVLKIEVAYNYAVI